MKRSKLITALIVAAVIVLLAAIFYSCRQGTRPPAERLDLDETGLQTQSSAESAPLFVLTSMHPRRIFSYRSLRESDKASESSVFKKA